MNLIDTVFWLCLTVYYEARGESATGQKAVCKVILNRAKAKGWPVKNIVHSKKQFSCYNDGLSASLLHIKNIPKLVEIHETVQRAIQEWSAGDTLRGATHYYAIKGMVNNKPPWWVNSDKMKFIVEIEGHRFLREG